MWQRLWIGGLADAEGLASGNPFEITTVVSLSENPVETRRGGMTYLQIRIEDDEPVSVRQFDAIMDGLYENIRGVVVYCNVHKV